MVMSLVWVCHGTNSKSHYSVTYTVKPLINLYIAYNTNRVCMMLNFTIVNIQWFILQIQIQLIEIHFGIYIIILRLDISYICKWLEQCFSLKKSIIKTLLCYYYFFAREVISVKSKQLSSNKNSSVHYPILFVLNLIIQNYTQVFH